MNKRKKQKDQQDKATAKILLATAIIKLIEAALDFIKDLLK